ADSNEIRPVERSANTLRRTWGLHESFVVGYSGNFGRAHEFGTMLGAAASLLPENDIRFLLVGSGHHHGAVTAVVAGHKLHNVLLRPLQQIGNLAESLSASDVHLVSLLPQLEHCIVPSKFYGILAAGRPTIFIGDADGEVARLIARSGCGMHVPIGAVDELAAAIRHLRDRPDIRVEMGEKARQLLLSEYSHEKAVDAWCSLFVRLQPAKLRATERVPS
ncbi:MAG: glycosyltransferase, partial [Oxalobacteraceae bacterium]